jgi:acyl-CoA reductase-like NAD-dependent aldehyde dehydrogenase
MCIQRNFGPVVALTTFSSTEEAIAIANDILTV